MERTQMSCSTESVGGVNCRAESTEIQAMAQTAIQAMAAGKWALAQGRAGNGAAPSRTAGLAGRAEAPPVPSG
jgi:hypothetical protein